MKRTINISYHWKTEDTLSIPEELEKDLADHAEERIIQMMKEGYIEGDLYFHVDDFYPEYENMEMHGWWKVKRGEA